jgi:hypothetical protein
VRFSGSHLDQRWKISFSVTAAAVYAYDGCGNRNRFDYLGYSPDNSCVAQLDWFDVSIRSGGLPMFRTATLASVLGAALVAGTASKALAQFQNLGGATITSTPNTIANAAPIYSTNSALGNYNPYGYGYYFNYPNYSDMLAGVAKVIDAQGTIMTKQQEAFILKEKARQARIDSRRKELEQWLWERENLPTLEDERQRLKEVTLIHARFGADLPEIWSAKALNDLLDDAKKITSPGADAAAAPLSDEVLAKINVTSGAGKGSVGLIKDGKLAFWPILLNRQMFEKERERLSFLVEKAVRLIMAGTIKGEDIEELSDKLAELQDKLSGMARGQGDNAPWSQSAYVEAKRFLNQFDDLIIALRSPDAANFLSGKYVLKGKNIAEVVKYMGDNGLKFAPATEGSQSAYNAVYDALRSYDEQSGSKTRDKR